MRPFNALILLVLLFLGIHFYLGWGPIQRFSPTYDEPVHLAAGTIYWKTHDFRYNGGHHPPFAEMWAAVPLIFLNPLIPVHHPAFRAQRWAPVDQYRFADRFLYSNRISSDRMIFWGRVAQLIFSCLFGLILILILYRRYGLRVGGVAGAFWGLSPTFLGHGTTISTDLQFSSYFFLVFLVEGTTTGWVRRVFMGISAGLCVGSKYTAIILLPALGALIAWRLFRGHQEKLKILFKKGIADGFLVFIIGFFTLWMVYGLGSLEPFFQGVSQIFGRAQSGRATFLLGNQNVGGWWFYFPTAFFLKSPTVIFIGLGLSLFYVWKRKIRIPDWLWIPPIIFMMAACTSKIQIGHRHIMAIYPFLFTVAALGVAEIPRKWFGVYVSLLILHAGQMFWVRPHFLSFFNPLFGGISQGHKFLSDSNVDWGQGLGDLGHWLKEKGRPPIFLSYFGTAEPHNYGIQYIDILSDPISGHSDDREQIKEPPKYFAISTTHKQMTYFRDKTIFSWLDELVPVKRIGPTIWVYDLTQVPDRQQYLWEIIKTPQ